MSIWIFGKLNSSTGDPIVDDTLVEVNDGEFTLRSWFDNIKQFITRTNRRPKSINDYFIDDQDDSPFRVYQADGTPGIHNVDDLDGDYSLAIKDQSSLHGAGKDEYRISLLNDMGVGVVIHSQDYRFSGGPSIDVFNITDAEETGAKALISGNKIRFGLQFFINNVASGPQYTYDMPINPALTTSTLSKGLRQQLDQVIQKTHDLLVQHGEITFANAPANEAQVTRVLEESPLGTKLDNHTATASELSSLSGWSDSAYSTLSDTYVIVARVRKELDQALFYVDTGTGPRQINPGWLLATGAIYNYYYVGSVSAGAGEVIKKRDQAIITTYNGNLGDTPLGDVANRLPTILPPAIQQLDPYERLGLGEENVNDDGKYIRINIDKDLNVTLSLNTPEGTGGGRVPPEVDRLPSPPTTTLIYLNKESVKLAEEQFFVGYVAEVGVSGERDWYGISAINHSSDPPLIQRADAANHAATILNTPDSGFGAIYYRANNAVPGETATGPITIWVDESKGVVTSIHLEIAPQATEITRDSIVMPVTPIDGTVDIGAVTYKRYIVAEPASPYHAESTWINLAGADEPTGDRLYVSVHFDDGSATSYLQRDGTKALPEITEPGYYAGLDGKWERLYVGAQNIPETVSRLPLPVTNRIIYLDEDSPVIEPTEFFTGHVSTTAAAPDFYGVSAINNAGNPPLIQRVGIPASDVLETAKSGLGAVYFRETSVASNTGTITVWLKESLGDMSALHIELGRAGTPPVSAIMAVTKVAGNAITVDGVAYNRFTVDNPPGILNSAGNWISYSQSRIQNLHIAIHFGAGRTLQFLKADGTKSNPTVATPGYFAGFNGSWVKFIPTGATPGPSNPTGIPNVPDHEDEARQYGLNVPAKEGDATWGPIAQPDLDTLFGIHPETLVADASDILIDVAGGGDEEDSQLTPWKVSAEQANVDGSEIRVAYDMRWTTPPTQNAPTLARMSIARNVGASPEVPDGWAKHQTVPINIVGVGVATFEGPFEAGDWRVEIETVASPRGLLVRH